MTPKHPNKQKRQVTPHGRNCRKRERTQKAQKKNRKPR